MVNFSDDYFKKDVKCATIIIKFNNKSNSIFFYKYAPLNKILYILLFCMYSLFMIKEIKDTYPKVKVLSIVTYILILIGLSLAII